MLLLLVSMAAVAKILVVLNESALMLLESKAVVAKILDVLTEAPVHHGKFVAPRLRNNSTDPLRIQRYLVCGRVVVAACRYQEFLRLFLDQGTLRKEAAQAGQTRQAGAVLVVASVVRRISYRNCLMEKMRTHIGCKRHRKILQAMAPVVVASLLALLLER